MKRLPHDDQVRRHEHEILISSEHLDALGHVGNATYLELYFAARIAWSESNGYSLEDFVRLGVLPAFTDIHLRFQREIRAGQRIRVSSWVTSYEGKIFVIDQAMTDEEGRISSEVTITGGLF